MKGILGFYSSTRLFGNLFSLVAGSSTINAVEGNISDSIDLLLIFVFPVYH